VVGTGVFVAVGAGVTVGVGMLVDMGDGVAAGTGVGDDATVDSIVAVGGSGVTIAARGRASNAGQSSISANPPSCAKPAGLGSTRRT
jgi:hypothetical protein